MLEMHFRRLTVWAKAMALTSAIYKLTQSFPDAERYGLTSQLRRAAVSVPSNIAEGSQRGGNKEFRQFLLIAKGSLAELETQLCIALDLQFISSDDCAPLLSLIEELNKMIYSLHAKLVTRTS